MLTANANKKNLLFLFVCFCLYHKPITFFKAYLHIKNSVCGASVCWCVCVCANSHLH